MKQPIQIVRSNMGKQVSRVVCYGIVVNVIQEQKFADGNTRTKWHYSRNRFDDDDDISNM